VTSYLIRGGCVLTMGRANLACGDVLIQDGLITEIGEGIRARDAEVVDATDAIVMPGFVDAHRHTWDTLLRNSGIADVADLVGQITPDELHTATLLGLLGALGSGTTTVVDWCDAASTPGHVDAALQAHADAGIRGVFAPGAWAASDWKAALRRASSGAGEATAVAAGAPGPGEVSAEALGVAWGAARDLGVRIHAHAGTHPDRAEAAAAVAGLLGDDIVLVHGTRLSGDDLNAVASAGCSIVLTPTTEMTSGFGPPPVQALIDRDMRPGLGVDSEREAPGDMFAPTRALISVQHAAYFEQKLVGKAGLPRLMSTRDAIRHATVDGARAAGLSDRVGVLEPGHAADLIVLRGDRPNIHPVNDPVGAVVWGMDTSNVAWVFVGGRPVKRDGTLVRDDVAALVSRAVSARDALMARRGRQPVRVS
jgi:cytosine/adenosine deaminase-related metal-dependent hydrolase